MRTKHHPGILLLAVLLVFAAPAAGHADNLFRLFPEAQLTGFYDTNLTMRTSNGDGDFGTAAVAGFFLDYTSEARYATLHYDTFAQLFLHESRYDRAGEGQFVSGSDDENLSRRTKLRLDEFFFRDATPQFSTIALTTNRDAPQFNTVMGQILLANRLSAINQIGATLVHDWGRNWGSDFVVLQQTQWLNANNSSGGSTAYEQSVSGRTEYHFSPEFSLGGGYRYFDFRYTAAGQPGEMAHWPFARSTWRPMENLYLSAMAGVVISRLQGSSSETVSLGAGGLLEYQFHRGQLKIHGGQEPSLSANVGSASKLRGVEGNVSYVLTPRLTGGADGAFYQSNGTVDSQVVFWDFGLGQRVNKWLGVYAKFVQIRRNQSSTEAVGNYVVIGCDVSIEAFRWSWQ